MWRDDLGSIVPVDLEEPGMHLAGAGCRVPTSKQQKGWGALQEHRVKREPSRGRGYLIAVVLLRIVGGSDHDPGTELQM